VGARGSLGSVRVPAPARRLEPQPGARDRPLRRADDDARDTLPALEPKVAGVFSGLLVEILDDARPALMRRLDRDAARRQAPDAIPGVSVCRDSSRDADRLALLAAG